MFKKIKGLRGILYRKLKKVEEEEVEKLPGFRIRKVEKFYELPEVKDPTEVNIVYPLIEPFTYAHIKWDPSKKAIIYNVIEPKLSKKEKKLLEKISEALMELIEVRFTKIKEMKVAIDYLQEQVMKIIKEFGLKLSSQQFMKIMYYIYRNFIGYNEIDPLLNDPNIEDISCDGIGLPIYIIHRKYGSLKTNIVFEEIDKLRDLVIKLAERCGRYVSYAEPILAGTLPDGSRVSATLAGDVATRGPTFTLRKFGVKPFSPIDQIELKTADSEILAYLWYLIESRASILIVGGVATGKCIIPTNFIQLANGELRSIKEVYEEILRNPRKIELLTLNPFLKVVPIPVNKFWRFRAPEILYKIETETGSTITTTPEHEFICLKNGKVVRIRADELEKGDHIATVRKIDIKGKTQEIGLEWIDEKMYPLRKSYGELLKVVKRKYKVSELARRLGLKYKTVEEWLKGRNKIPFLILKKLCEEFNFDFSSLVRKCGIKYKGFSNSMELITKTSPHLLKLVGYVIGDGGIYRNKVCFFNSSAELREEFIRCAREIGLKVREEFPKNKVEKVVIENKVFVEFLKKVFEIPLKNKSKTIRIPSIVMRCSIEEIKEFVKALFDSEGNVLRNECEIEFSTTSEILAYQLAALIRRFGIVTRLRKNKNCYRLIISGKRDLEKYLELIGFSEKRKIEMLRRIINKTKKYHTNVDVLPINSTLEEILERNKISISKLAKASGIARESLRDILNRKCNPSIWMVEKIKNGLEKLKIKDSEFLRFLLNSDVFWDEVKRIEKKFKSEKWVYDFTVDLTHNFIAGDGGLLVISNTSFLNSIAMFIEPEAKIVSIEDSVTGDEEIIWERNGRFYKTKISELIDPLLGNKSSVRNNFGIKIFTNKNGKIELVEPSLFLRHKVKKKIFEIELQSGRKIKVTKDHSLFSLNENAEIVPIKCDEIKIGDFIATPRFLPINGKGVRINLLEKLKNLRNYFVEGKSIRKLIEENEKLLMKYYSKSGIKYCLKNGFLRADVFKKICGERKGYFLRTKYGTKIPLNLKIDGSFCRAIGLWLANGYYDKNSIIFSVAGEERKEIENFAKKFKVNCRLRPYNFSLMLNSKLLKEIFENVLGLKGNVYTKKLPSWVLNLRKREKAELLKGYFSGDGWVRENEVAIRSASIKLLKDVQTLLFNFGILLRISTKRLKDKTFEARISGEFLKEFYQQINFISNKKRMKLRKILKESFHDVTDIIPISRKIATELRNELKDELKSRIKDISLYSWARYERSNIGRRYLQSLLSNVPQNKNPINRLYKLASNDIFWDKVKGIKGEIREENVYDISVPGTENFICENVIAHNTRELKLVHEHWIPGLARVGFGIPTPTGEKYGEVTLFDLLKESFRQNPDYLIVGEVRGKETYVMFQGMASGHSCLSTFHAGSLDTVIKRLITPPINLPPSLVESLDVVIIMQRAKEKGKSARRIKEIVEIVSVDVKTNRIFSNVVYRWDPVEDVYKKINESVKVEKFAILRGLTKEEALKEIERRKKVIEWMRKKGIKDYLEVIKVINEYYKVPERVIERVRAELKEEIPIRIKEKIPRKIEKIEKKPEVEVSKMKREKKKKILENLGFIILRE